MKRKIIQIAGSTQLVSIPRNWALKHNIKKGDEIEVTEKGNILVLNSGKSAKKGSITVDVSGLERDTLMFLVRTLYKNGYDDILINFPDKIIKNIKTGEDIKVIDIIVREVSRLNGMEIFEQRESSCTLKNLSEESSKVFDNILRRVFVLTLEIIGDLRDGFKDSNMFLLDSVQAKHDTITRFVSYSQRLLHKVGNPNNDQTDSLYHILEVIDELVDLIKFSAREILNYKIKPSGESIRIYSSIYSSFELFYRLFYNFNFDDISKISRIKHSTMDSFIKSASKMSKKELMILAQVEPVFEKITNLTVSTMSYKY